MRSTTTRTSTRVVHVSSAHPWTDNRVHLREAASLADAGYSVTLVAVANNIELDSTGVTVVKIRRRGRLARMTLGSLEAIRLALRTEAEIVHLHDPELVWAIPLLRLAGRKVIYDAHEDLPAQVADKHYLPAWARTVGIQASRLVVLVAGSSHRIVAATDKVAERFPARKTVVVKNYPRLRDVDGEGEDLLQRPHQVAYVGAVSMSRGSDVMMETLANSSFPDGWRLELAGAFVPAELEAASSRLPGWNRVDYRGVVSPSEARDIALRSRIGLVVLKNTQAYRDALPTKMFEYFSAGIPVIASDFPLWRSIIDEYGCGTLVDPDSAVEVASAISAYANSPELLRRQGEAARIASIQHLNWSSQESILISMYDELSSR